MAAGAGDRDREGAVRSSRTTFDDAGEIDEQRAVLELRRGEARQHRLGLGAEAEVDVEPGEVAHGLRPRLVELAHELAPERRQLGRERQPVRPAADVEPVVGDADGGDGGLGRLRAGVAPVAVVDGGRLDLLMVGKGEADQLLRRRRGRVGVRVRGGLRRVGLLLAIGQLDHALARRALDLADQELFRRRDRRRFAQRARLRGFGRRLRRRRLRVGPIADVEREVARADEGGADPAVAAEIDVDRRRVRPDLDPHVADPAARDLVEGALGAEVEPLAGEDDGCAALGGLERPFGRRLDRHDDAGEAVVLAAADRAAFGREDRRGGAEQRREADRYGFHAARLCLEARSAPSSSL